MSTNRRTRGWRKIGLLLGPLGLAGCTKTTEAYLAGHQDKEWPARSFLADRAAVQEPLRRQAVNGAVAQATLYNHYFERITQELVVGADKVPTGEVRQLTFPRPTALLTPWGRNLLDRLARHAVGGRLCVYVQTAGDAPARGGPAAAAKARADLDERRVKEVRDYLAAARPDLAATVEVIDLDAVGLSGPEGKAGYNKLLLAPRGYLERDDILGASIGFSNTLTSGQLQGGATTGAAPGQVPPPATPETPLQPGGSPGGLSPAAPGGDGGLPPPALPLPPEPAPAPEPPPKTPDPVPTPPPDPLPPM